MMNFINLILDLIFCVFFGDMTEDGEDEKEDKIDGIDGIDVARNWIL